MSANVLVNPAGGLRYHLRAARYSRKLWQPFRWAVGEWLLDWQPPETTLVLVGPSAGYNLQPFLFERFRRVIALEPDPVARYLFKRRLAKAPLDERPALEMLAEDHLLASPERLGRLLDEHQACVLFSNVIGQLAVLLGAQDAAHEGFERVRTGVANAIRGRSWASFHDRFSGSLRPVLEGTLIGDGRLTDAELVEAVYAGGSAEAEPSKPSELLDHLTAGFFPEELPHAYFSWELEPGSYHLIEGVKSVRPSAGVA
ncbi:MAG: hypothetical protein QM756_41595 [Polyangiaceae bacterium]